MMMTHNDNAAGKTPLPPLEGWVAAYDEEQLTEIPKCYCPSCGGSNASSNILPTKIPMFREIIVMSTSCEDCGYQNSEISFGGTIQEKGERLTLNCSSAEDLNRQIIKSDSCTLSIPSIELEIPPNTQRGVISTLEVSMMCFKIGLQSCCLSRPPIQCNLLVPFLLLGNPSDSRR